MKTGAGNAQKKKLAGSGPGSGPSGGTLKKTGERSEEKLAGSGHAWRAAQLFQRFLLAVPGRFPPRFLLRCLVQRLGQEMGLAAAQTVPKGTLGKLAGCSKRNFASKLEGPKGTPRKNWSGCWEVSGSSGNLE